MHDLRSASPKKPFGIFVTPQNSPVLEERFTGYHTGVDFEVLPDEAEMAIPVFVICEGQLRVKQWVRGYVQDAAELQAWVDPL